MEKETCRDAQEHPDSRLSMVKETYIYGKRDLCIWKKRPIYMEKETCRDAEEHPDSRLSALRFRVTFVLICVIW